MYKKIRKYVVFHGRQLIVDGILHFPECSFIIIHNMYCFLPKTNSICFVSLTD